MEEFLKKDMMSTKNRTRFTRRRFVSCCACLAATADLQAASDSASKEEPRNKLYDPLSPQEEEIATSSPMVKEILAVKGCSCAESVLLATLRYLKQPEELLHSAAALWRGNGAPRSLRIPDWRIHGPGQRSSRPT